MKHLSRWLRKTLFAVIVAEIFYLVLINLVLSIPQTQSLISQIKPDKFAVSWQQAWSWYPFRVHARGVSANGQSKGQQWQVDAAQASASISLIPLLWKTVSLSGAEAMDVDFRLRPRPREGKDYSAIQPFFAAIENRQLETEPAPIVPPKEGKPWDISVEGIRASGKHHVWVYQLQADLQGELGAAIKFQTRGGPFSLQGGKVDADINSIVINGDREVVRDGRIDGTLEFSPFVPKENKGLKVLEYLSLDADIRTETESLAFLNYYLADFQGLNISGRGNVDGHLVYRDGRFAVGNQMNISASDLAVDMLDYRAQGTGDIHVEVNEAEPDVLAFEIRFNELEGLHRPDNEVLITGDGMSFSGKGRTKIIAGKNNDEAIAESLTVEIPSIKVPDMARFQRFLSERISLVLLGGEGALESRAVMTQFGLSSVSRLTSKAADIAVKDFEFQADLDMNLNIDAPQFADSGVDVAGTYIHINDARLSSDEVGRSEPWSAAIDVDKGRVKLILPDGISDHARLSELIKGIKGKEILPMLDSDSEQLRLRGTISDLRWLNVLLKNRFDLNIRGAGNISADVVIDSGWLAPGTEFNIIPKNLIVEVLDYIAQGEGGQLKLAVDKGGETPDVSIDIAMNQASFKSKDDEQAFVEDTDIKLQALIRNLTFEGGDPDLDLHLQIPSARVKDMSVYNTYFPPNSPVQIIDGQAELNVDVTFQPESASGYVKLYSTAMNAMVDDQAIKADMNVDIKLVGGVPKNMDFDIAGSTVVINNVKVTGDEKNFDDDNWGILLNLNKARAVWKKPVQLELEAGLNMTDSRPFVAMMANKKGKDGWMGKAMTIDDVEGQVNMRMKNQIIVIPYAFAGSDKIDVGAKAIITKDNHDGVLYARFRKLHGILKINNGDRNLDILMPGKKFDEYVPDKSKLE